MKYILIICSLLLLSGCGEHGFEGTWKVKITTDGPKNFGAKVANMANQQPLMIGTDFVEQGGARSDAEIFIRESGGLRYLIIETNDLGEEQSMRIKDNNTLIMGTSSILFTYIRQNSNQDMNDTHEQQSQKLQDKLALMNESNPEALVLLGKKYEIGQGRDKNISTALLFYEKAAKHGSNDAMLLAGLIYIAGADGVSKDFKKGSIHLYNSAESGSAQAQYVFGKYLLDGIKAGTVVAGMREMGEVNLEKAVEQGIVEAKEYLGYHYYERYKNRQCHQKQ